jgi:hypothetical protein
MNRPNLKQYVQIAIQAWSRTKRTETRTVQRENLHSSCHCHPCRRRSCWRQGSSRYWGKVSSNVVLPVVVWERSPKNLITSHPYRSTRCRFWRPIAMSFGLRWKLGWKRCGRRRKVVKRDGLIWCVCVMECPFYGHREAEGTNWSALPSTSVEHGKVLALDRKNVLILQTCVAKRKTAHACGVGAPLASIIPETRRPDIVAKWALKEDRTCMCYVLMLIYQVKEILL